MKMNGHDWIDILKVDVEGAEFQIMPEIVKDFGKGNLPFGQLLMEIHAERTPNAYKTEEFGEWWHLLEDAGLRAFNSELNYPGRCKLCVCRTPKNTADPNVAMFLC